MGHAPPNFPNSAQCYELPFRQNLVFTGRQKVIYQGPSPLRVCELTGKLVFSVVFCVFRFVFRVFRGVFSVFRVVFCVFAVVFCVLAVVFCVFAVVFRVFAVFCVFVVVFRVFVLFFAFLLLFFVFSPTSLQHLLAQYPMGG